MVLIGLAVWLFPCNKTDLDKKFHFWIKYLWEKAILEAALFYLNDAKIKLSYHSSRNHGLSEAVTFIGCLQYNNSKVITAPQIA